MKTLFNFRSTRWMNAMLTFLILTFCLSTDMIGQTSGKDFDIAIKNYNHFMNEGDFDKAQNQARAAYKFASKKSNVSAKANALILEARAYLKMTKRTSKKRKKAKESLEESLVLLSNVNNERLTKETYSMLQIIAEKDGDAASALIYKDKINDMALLKSKQIEERRLAQEKQALQSSQRALESNKRQLEREVKDLNKDVSNLESVQEETHAKFVEQKSVADSLHEKSEWDALLLAKTESEMQLQKDQIIIQQGQLDLQKSQRNFSYALAGIISLLFVGMGMRYMETRKHNAVLQAKNEIIQTEKARSEELLLNILPSLVANELKISGNAKARSYTNASVLFTDFVKFGAMAQTLRPEVLVDVLDFYFKSFDEIISKYRVEKIKTIGDAYMVASGLPQEDPDNPLEIVKAGLEIQEFVNNIKVQRQKDNLPFFDARVGIHTGPLVAGVVGNKKFAYDIWGDTVNVAARLETNCDPGRVNVSASTHEYIKDYYNCEFRGEIPVKNRDDVGMYYVQVKAS